MKEHPPACSNGRFGAGSLASQFDVTNQAGAGQARGQKPRIGSLDYGPVPAYTGVSDDEVIEATLMLPER